MNYVAIFLLIIVFAACNKKQPACDSEQVKTMLLTVFKKDLKKHLAGKAAIIKSNYEKLFPVYTDSIVASYLRNGIIQFQNIVTTGKKEGENACSCKATLWYWVSEDFLTNYKKNAVLVTDTEYFIDPNFLNLNVDTQIGYSVQLTDGVEKVNLEAGATEDLRYSLEQFIFLYALNKTVMLKLNKPE
jgi:hypothetical protein